MGDGAGGGSDLSLQLVAGLGHLHGSTDETDTPARHGKTFRHAVNGNHLVFNEIELSNAFVTAHKIDVFVNFVRHDHHLRVFGDHFSDSTEFLLGVDHTRGIRRTAEHHQFGFRSDGCLQLSRSNLEIVLDLARNVFDFGFCHLRDGAVGNPIGSGDNHLVTRVHQSHNCLIDSLFATSRNYNLLRGVIQIIVSFELMADGFQQVGITGDWRVMREIVVNSLFGVFLHGFRRVEIGFTDAQADNILTFIL